MESERFDALVREAVVGASRRDLTRAGLAVFFASGLAAGGLPPDDAAAGNKQKRRRRRRRRKNNKNKKQHRCSGNRPVTCGDGCCPENYSLCCDNAREASNSNTCNPPGATCCPLEQGGGSCEGSFSVCCDATPQNPYGTCTVPGGTCCPAELGGGECQPDEPVCCPDEDPMRTGYCCPAGGACCRDDLDCESSNCRFGCCLPIAALDAASARARRGRTAQGSKNRFLLSAR